MAAKCIPVAGYTCVKSTKRKIIPPKSSAIINRGYTPDTLSGTRAVSNSTTDRLGVVTTNYSINSTGTKKTSCQTFSAALLNTQQITFRGNVSFAAGSSVTGLGNNIIPSDTGSSSDGESIISSFGGTTLSLKSINGGSQDFAATVNSDTVTLALSSTATITTFNASGTATVTGNATLGTATISNGLTATNSVSFSGATRIKNLEPGATFFSGITAATGKLVVGSAPGTVSSLVPTAGEITARARLTVDSGTATGLAFSASTADTLNSTMPEYMNTTGYEIVEGDLLVSTGNSANRYNAYHMTNPTGILCYNDSGLNAITPGRVYKELTVSGALTNANVIGSLSLAESVNGVTMTIPYLYTGWTRMFANTTLSIRVGGVLFGGSSSTTSGFTIEQDASTPSISEGTDGDGTVRVWSRKYTYITSNIVSLDIALNYDTWDHTQTSYGGLDDAPITYPLRPLVDQYYLFKFYYSTGVGTGYCDIVMLLRTTGTLTLYRIAGDRWPSKQETTATTANMFFNAKVFFSV